MLDLRRGFKLTLLAVVDCDPLLCQSSIISHNGAGNKGGGFYFDYEMLFPIFLGVIFENNVAAFQGGALYFGVVNGGLVVDRSKFLSNIAFEGAGLYFFTYNYGIQFMNTKFSLNVVTSNGGSIFFASGNGIGLFMDDNAVHFFNCEISSNDAPENGGGIHIFYENFATFEHCHFSNNEAAHGGAMNIDDGNNVIFISCKFNNNSATEAGALLLQNLNTVEITDCLFHGNNAKMNGGGLYFKNDSTVSFYGQNEFSDCRASKMGGGILLFGATLWDLGNAASMRFLNCIANHGSAVAMVALKYSSVELHDIIFEDNAAISGGTLYWYFDHSRPEGSHEPAGLNSTSLTWLNNSAPYGKKYCTQPVFLDAAPTYEATVYYTALDPGSNLMHAVNSSTCH